MLKFRSKDEEYVKISEINGMYNKPIRHNSICDQIDFEVHQGAIVDRRLSEILFNNFKEDYLPISVFRLFANRVARCGKRQSAEKIVAGILALLRENGVENVHSMVHRIVEQIKTRVSLHIYKKGRKTVLIPYLMTPQAAYKKAARLILGVARNDRRENGLMSKVAAEIKDIRRSVGYVVEDRIDFEKLVSDNYNSYRQIRPYRRKRGQFRK